MSDRLAIPALILLFSLLWVPVGQHPFLLENWMKIGTISIPLLLVAAWCIRPQRAALADPRFVSLILLIAYIIHQFEEHWIDIFGRNYAFKPYLNTFLSDITGQGNTTEFMTNALIFVINTSLVWLVAALAIWQGNRHVFATLCMVAIVVVNAVSHIAAGVASWTYNPGLVTAVSIFAPLGLGAYVVIIQNKAASMRLIAASLLWALFAHLVMISGILSRAFFGHPSELIYYVILITWSVLPSLVFRSQPEKRQV